MRWSREHQHDRQDPGSRERSLHRYQSDATRDRLQHQQLPLDEKPGRSPTPGGGNKPRVPGLAVRPPPYSVIANRARASDPDQLSRNGVKLPQTKHIDTPSFTVGKCVDT
jgi:hypothetical protein